MPYNEGLPGASSVLRGSALLRAGGDLPAAPTGVESTLLLGRWLGLWLRLGHGEG